TKRGKVSACRTVGNAQYVEILQPASRGRDRHGSDLNAIAVECPPDRAKGRLIDGLIGEDRDLRRFERDDALAAYTRIALLGKARVDRGEIDAHLHSHLRYRVVQSVGIAIDADD